ncbi:Calmodulin-binding protein 60 B [Linum perenne]
MFPRGKAAEEKVDGHGGISSHDTEEFSDAAAATGKHPSSMLDFPSKLEPVIRSVIREEVNKIFRRASGQTTESLTLGVPAEGLVLQFVNKIPSTIFTGSKIEAEDGGPVRIQLLNASSNTIVNSGPFSSLQVEITVLNGDFVSEEWSNRDFNNNVIRERDGRRPLVTGDRNIVLSNGTGQLTDLVFTDNSSWIRCRKFRLGAKPVLKSTCGEVFRIREARTEPFVVKDYRGELYKKHHPPRLGDEVWRLEKVAKGGALHNRLSSFGINTVKDLLKANAIDQPALRKQVAGGAISNKRWEKIMAHASTCEVDGSKFYSYGKHGEGVRLLFDPVYKLIGASFDDEQSYIPLDKLTHAHKNLVELFKQGAIRDRMDMVPVDSASVAFSSLMPWEGGDHQGKSVSSFVTKTYQLVDDPSTDHIVSWVGDGSTFLVWLPVELSRDILPKYFKHSNFSSFIRQLNTFGFRKVTPERWEFANEYFKKGEEHLLRQIKRRKGHLFLKKDESDLHLDSKNSDTISSQSSCLYNDSGITSRRWKQETSTATYSASSASEVTTWGQEIPLFFPLGTEEEVASHVPDWFSLPKTEPYLKEKSAWRKIRIALKLTSFLMKRRRQIAAAGGNDHHHIILIDCSFPFKESLWNYVDENLSISDEQALSIIKVKGNKNPDEPVEAAAVRIQNKFRSWKGRREFLVVLQQIVKIQAHVRGHHVRKNLKIISLGIVEKAVILRCKRNSSGLRKVKPELVKHGIEMSSAAQRSWGTLLSLNSRFQEQHETKQMKDKKLEAMQFGSSTDLLKHDLRSCNSMVTQEFYISKYPSFQISAHNFVSLLFPYCSLQQLWKGEEQLLVNLKYMDLNHSNLSEIPNLSKAQKLESVNLEGCENLVGVTSIQYLTKLKHLNLKGCQGLKGLPSLIRLKFLNTLDLSHCSSLTRLPPSLGCLPNLCELNLRNCTKLDYLPRTVMHLMRSLETLNVSGCYSLWKPVSKDVEIHSNLISESTEDTCAEPQLIKPAEIDAAGDSPSQGLPSELEQMRGKKAIEWELDEDISMATPLIDYLPSELRTRLLLPPATDFSPSSYSSKENKNRGVVQEEDQQQLFEDNDDHGDETGTVSVCCQVEDCGIDLSRAETYHQHHKICEVHCQASKALVGDLLQRFCLQCCRFHDLEDFEDEERNCRSRVAGYHQKQRRQSIATEEEQHPTLLHKRRRSGDDAREQDWDEKGNDAFGSIENDIVEMVERLSNWNGDGKEVPESVVAWLAELEQSVPETVISMKSAKAEAGAAGEKLKEMDVKLIVGRVELSLLDKELSRILEEEEEIEAQLQRLMDSKSGHGGAALKDI